MIDATLTFLYLLRVLQVGQCLVDFLENLTVISRFGIWALIRNLFVRTVFILVNSFLNNTQFYFVLLRVLFFIFFICLIFLGPHPENLHRWRHDEFLLDFDSLGHLLVRIVCVVLIMAALCEVALLGLPRHFAVVVLWGAVDYQLLPFLVKNW